MDPITHEQLKSLGFDQMWLNSRKYIHRSVPVSMFLVDSRYGEWRMDYNPYHPRMYMASIVKHNVHSIEAVEEYLWINMVDAWDRYNSLPEKDRPFIRV